MKHILWMAVLAFAAPALASTRDTVANVPMDVMNVRTLDEIVISGNRDSLSRARRAMQAAEDRFIERLNALNDDHRYDIVCRVEAPTGTHLQFRVCEPRFLGDELREESLRVFGNFGGSTADLSLIAGAEVQRLAALRDAKQRALVQLRTDVDLRRALLEHARLYQHYKELHARKFQNRLVVWD